MTEYDNGNDLIEDLTLYVSYTTAEWIVLVKKR